MDIRQITPAYASAPQIDPADAAAIKAAGFVTVICNRPDAEVPPSHQADALRAAIEAEGMTFVVNPVTHQGLNDDMVALQAQAAEGGKTLAYCASGTRSTIVWALTQAGKMDPDAIIAAAAQGGYDISGLRDRLA
ncbi:TIGR01244 family sulfur transferase [Loktanella sp. R86503]|uniref:TIGR01244 family sulfur transferase n=1 Tax=Loktanella TaxID=245186 RepID=UPI0036D92BFB